MEKQKALYLYISTRILIDAGETELAEKLYDQAEEMWYSGLSADEWSTAVPFSIAGKAFYLNQSWEQIKSA